jgi:hypothetical protein
MILHYALRPQRLPALLATGGEHANPGITMDIYTHAVDRKKRSAQSKVVQMVLPNRQLETGEVMA